MPEKETTIFNSPKKNIPLTTSFLDNNEFIRIEIRDKNFLPKVGDKLEYGGIFAASAIVTNDIFWPKNPLNPAEVDFSVSKIKVLKVENITDPRLAGSKDVLNVWVDFVE